MKISYLFLFVLMLIIDPISLFSQERNSFFSINTEKDLIPEGIATTKTHIYLSSILKNKILKIHKKTKVVEDFIVPLEYGFKSGLGLFIRKNKLFAISNDDSASIYIFSLKDKRVLKKISFRNAKNHLWNDLHVINEKNIFITDTYQSCIYKVNAVSGEVKLFLSDSTLEFANGISYSKSSGNLFVASDTYGIRIINVKTKKILNQIDRRTTDIDGLKYYQKKLFFVMKPSDKSKHGIYSVSLTNKQSQIGIINSIYLDSLHLDIPTTLDIHNKQAYWIMNSQMRNLNQEKKTIIDSSKLKSILIGYKRIQ